MYTITHLRGVACPKTKPAAASACARDAEGGEPAAARDVLLPLPTTRLTGTVMLGWRLAKARCARAVRFLCGMRVGV